MGVYIKDLKVPENCDLCPIFLNFTTCGCDRDHCMFQDVPEPHGDLIDRKALMGRIEHDTPLSSTFEKIVRRYIENAPTIIPVSVSESEERPAFLPQYELTPRSEEE